NEVPGCGAEAGRSKPGTVTAPSASSAGVPALETKCHSSSLVCGPRYRLSPLSGVWAETNHPVDDASAVLVGTGVYAKLPSWLRSGCAASAKKNAVDGPLH